MGAMVNAGRNAGKWLSVPIWPTQAPVATDAVNAGLFSLHSAPSRYTPVCTLTGGRTHLSCCTLDMGADSACTVLDSSCAGWKMSNMCMHGVHRHAAPNPAVPVCMHHMRGNASAVVSG